MTTVHIQRLNSALGRGALALLICVSACTRLNPAFKESEEGSSEAGSSEGTETLTTDGETGTSETGEVCELLEAPDVFPGLLQVETPFAECKDIADQWWLAVGLGEGLLDLSGPCTAECGSCDQGLVEFGVNSVLIDDTEPISQPLCLHAVGENPIDVGDDQHCAFEMMTMWGAGDPVHPLFVISGRDAGVPPALSSATLSLVTPFTVEAEPLGSCDCASNDVLCCEDTRPPTVYALRLSDDILVPSGENFTLSWAGVGYEFANIVAVDTSECGRGRDIAWALSQPGP